MHASISSKEVAKRGNEVATQLFDNLETHLLTYQQLAERLQVPVRTLRRYVALGRIPVKVFSHRHVRFYWPHIVEWLHAQKGAKKR